jgi:hypothetical protein
MGRFRGLGGARLAHGEGAPLGLSRVDRGLAAARGFVKRRGLPRMHLGSKAQHIQLSSRGGDAVADQTQASNELQQKYRQFLDLLPLTLSLAGLPPSETRLFSEEQIEARAITVKAANRVAKNLARECLGGS